MSFRSLIVALGLFLVGCMPHVDSQNPNAAVVVNAGNISVNADVDGDKWSVESQKIDACQVQSDSSEEFSDCIKRYENGLMEAGLTSGDCDDNDELVHPGAQEICDGKDNNCDGVTDEGCPVCPTAGCDDKNACTDDACVAGKCEFTSNTKTCDDGDACSLEDACFNGACISTTQKSCDDKNACTDDTCSPTKGCTNLNNVKVCDDGDPCTSGDKCANGTCGVGSTVKDCDDGNPCTTDSCDPVKGCISAPITDGSCCFGNGSYGDAFCGPSNPLNLPSTHIWGCQEFSTSTKPGVCTSCREADKDGFCANSELSCTNNWDDDGDGDVDEDDSDCDVCSVDSDCDDGNINTVDDCLSNGACSNLPKNPACTPICSNKQCGDDGCGGSCGDCAQDSVCSASSQCVKVPPAPTPEGTADCTDNVDNDGDGLIDCDDAGCMGSEICLATGDECEVDSDCANGKQCFIGTCYTVSGKCKRFGTTVPEAGTDLVYYDAAGNPMSVKSVKGLNVSPDGACSVVVPTIDSCPTCTCTTNGGTYPFSSHGILNSDAQCVWNQIKSMIGL